MSRTIRVTIGQLRSIISESWHKMLAETMTDERYRQLRDNSEARYLLSDAEYDEYLAKAKEEKSKEIYEKYVSKYEKNWVAVVAYFQELGFTNLDHLAQEKERFVTYNEFAQPNTKLTMVEKFAISGSQVMVTNTVKADKETGKVTNENVRFVFSGVKLPPEIQDAVNRVTGKKIKFHRPTGAWVYDSGIDGKVPLGDPRLDMIVKGLISTLASMR